MLLSSSTLCPVVFNFFIAFVLIIVSDPFTIIFCKIYIPAFELKFGSNKTKNLYKLQLFLFFSVFLF